MGIARRSAEIELRHLRYFVADAEHGSFRKVARPSVFRNPRLAGVFVISKIS